MKRRHYIQAGYPLGQCGFDIRAEVPDVGELDGGGLLVCCNLRGDACKGGEDVFHREAVFIVVFCRGDQLLRKCAVFARAFTAPAAACQHAKAETTRADLGECLGCGTHESVDSECDAFGVGITQVLQCASPIIHAGHGGHQFPGEHHFVRFPFAQPINQLRYSGDKIAFTKKPLAPPHRGQALGARSLRWLFRGVGAGK